MLEVGVVARAHRNASLTHTEARAHFAFWAVVSAPLVLGLDLTDTGRVAAYWDILANPEVLRRLCTDLKLSNSTSSRAYY